MCESLTLSLKVVIVLVIVIVIVLVQTNTIAAVEGYMYVGMVITYSKSKDQPGKVANPARGQLNRENE